MLKNWVHFYYFAPRVQQIVRASESLGKVDFRLSEIVDILFDLEREKMCTVEYFTLESVDTDRQALVCVCPHAFVGEWVSDRYFVLENDSRPFRTRSERYAEDLGAVNYAIVLDEEDRRFSSVPLGRAYPNVR